MKTNYWLKRQSDKRLFTSEELGKVAMSQSVAIYEQALRNVNSDIASIYRNYSKESGVDINLLQQILNGSDRASFLKSVKTSMVKFGLDATKIYSPEYLGRLSRLEALKEQLYWEIVSIAPDELDATGARYAEIVARTYGQTQLDLQHTGMSPTFSHINKSAIVDVLNSKWAGRNYSDSIWRNVNGLASDLPQIIGGGLTSGTSQEKMARQVRERYDVSVYESMRLIRTESNYFLNEAEGQSYEEREIEEYEYDAVPDSIRFTCNCFENDGLIFNVKDRIPGRNYPPLHPNCRCGTLPVLKGMKEEVDPKRAKTYNMPDRVERYAQDANSKVSNDIKERWKKAMTKQMTPDKKVHDYNADMNLLSQKLGKGDINEATFKRRLNELMLRIPEEYPLKGSLMKQAERMGWEREVSTDNQLLDKKFSKVDWKLDDVKLTKEQKKFILDSGIKFDNTSAEVSLLNTGEYDSGANSMSLAKHRIDIYAKQTDNPQFFDQVFKHELGHAVDYYGPLLKKDVDTLFSESPQFAKTMYGDSYLGLNEGASTIIKERFAKQITDKSTREAILNMDTASFIDQIRSNGAIKIGKIYREAPFDTMEYYASPREVFAEGYSMFFSDPEKFKKLVPDIYEYYNSLSQLEL